GPGGRRTRRTTLHRSATQPTVLKPAKQSGWRAGEAPTLFPRFLSGVGAAPARRPPPKQPPPRKGPTRVRFTELLDTLGYTPDEKLGISWRPVGGQFTSAVIPLEGAEEFVNALPESDIW